MKQALVQTLEQGGHTFGQVNNPDDLMKAQGFAQEQVRGVVSDFINRSSRPEIVGFDQTLGAGTAFNMTVGRGRVYTQNGISYDRDTSTTVTFDAAHATLPRFDIVVARIEDQVPSQLDLIPFVRRRTPDEFIDEVPAYPPANISAATEVHWKATIVIKKGTPAENPTKPTLASNEIPLYDVVIGAASISLSSANVLDNRGIVDTLRTVSDRDAAQQASLAEIYRRLGVVEDTGGQPIDFSGEIRSIEEILADLLNRATSSADYPEIRYNPSSGAAQYDPWDKRSSMIQAVGAFGSGVAHIDFNLGLTVNFGDAEVVLTPKSFVDGGLNARYYTPAGNEGAHLSRSELLTLNDVTPGPNDGSVAFSGTGLSLTPSRARAASAARDGRYVEIFGGQANDNYSALSDWHTYDRENNTLVTRTITGAALPASDRPAMFPIGDATHVLVIAGVGGDVAGTPRCFVVNAVTAVSVEISTTKPTGNEFLGDLIADNKIFIMSDKYNNGEVKFWEYTISTNTFVEINTTGNIPPEFLPYGGGFRDNGLGCYYAENQFVYVGIDSATYIFDRTTLQWTEVTVNKPFERQMGFLGGGHQGARMANINGRPQITGGFHLNSNGLENLGYDASWSYELTYSVPVPQATGVFGKPSLIWKESLIAIPRTVYHSFCSTLGPTNRANGYGFKVGGGGPYLGDQPQVYAARAAGLVVSSYNGQPGVSIADGSSFAQFEIDPFTTPFNISGYFASFSGRYTKQNLTVEISYDNGATWAEYMPDLAVVKVSGPVTRRMRITLRRSGANPPILTSVTESFDADSALDLEQRTVIRIDTPQDDDFYALYIDRLGKAKFLALSFVPLEPSSGRSCLLLGMIATAGYAPTLTPYINRRRPIERVTGVKDGTSSTAVDCSLAVPFRFFELRGVAASGKHYYRPPTQLATSTSSFRGQVTVPLAEVSAGDTYEVTFYG